VATCDYKPVGYNKNSKAEQEAENHTKHLGIKQQNSAKKIIIA
jgi:hypothetical protein